MPARGRALPQHRAATAIRILERTAIARGSRARFAFNLSHALNLTRWFLPGTRDARWQADLRVVRRERKIGIPERIALEDLSPAFAHGGDFPLTLAARFTIAPLRPLVFSVMETRMRRPNDAIARLANAQAEIDVGEPRREIAFVEAAHRSNAARGTAMQAPLTQDTSCVSNNLAVICRRACGPP